jgi:UDP-N-acetylmuramyl pentapeptide phosphotransferase/UDP-N-acetylglucosamine-1-phosphate transferase
MNTLALLGDSLPAIWTIPGAALTATVLAYVLGFPVRNLGLRLNIMDKPGHRSSHSTPTPRVGGVAILLAALAAALLFFTPTPAFLVATAVGIGIAAVSFFDDLISLPSLARLAVHFIVACACVYFIRLVPTGLDLPFASLHLPYAAAFALAVFFLVAFVNFFNFMDGINGIAASQGAFGAIGLAILLYIGGAANSVVTAAALGGACLGFLPHNFPKARMFMGDVGSTTLGFALAMLTLLGAIKTPLSWVACVLPLMPFIYDATFTLIKRILRGENFLKAHREHHYQLLIRSGWSHTRTTALYAALNALCLAAAIAYALTTSHALHLAILLALLALALTGSVLIHRKFRKTQQEADPDAAQPAG